MQVPISAMELKSANVEQIHCDFILIGHVLSRNKFQSAGMKVSYVHKAMCNGM